MIFVGSLESKSYSYTYKVLNLSFHELKKNIFTKELNDLLF